MSPTHTPSMVPAREESRSAAALACAGCASARVPVVDRPPFGDQLAQLAAVANAKATPPALEDEATLQRRFDGQAGSPAPIQRVAERNLTGMPDALKAGVEELSGMPLDHVRVHRNSVKPATLHAHAYAQGSEIHLAPGQEKHLPHEAWHVVQQARGRVKPTTSVGVTAINDDPALEHEADRMGGRAAQRQLKDQRPRPSRIRRSTPASPAPALAQLVKIKVDGEDYETTEHTVPELAAIAYRLVKADKDDPVAKQIFAAIKNNEYKDDEDELDDEPADAFATGESKEQADDPFADLEELKGTDVVVEDPEIDAELFSDGEIRNINAGIPDREAKGINSDIIGALLTSAKRSSTPAGKIGTLVWGIVRMHVFNDGNKRTGAIMLAQFAEKNKLKLTGDANACLLKAADVKSGYTEEQFCADLTKMLQPKH